LFEKAIVMDAPARFSSTEANRSAVFRTRYKKTAPDAARQVCTVHLRLKGDQP
jgi:hypothetical protein